MTQADDKDYRRWYDQDPVLSQAMQTLKETDDESQIKIALNLIKIITEHNLSESEYASVDEIISATEEGLKRSKRERWYDIDATLRTAIGLLQNCPATTRSIIAKEMAQMVVERFDNNGEEDIDDEDMELDESSIMDAPNIE